MTPKEKNLAVRRLAALANRTRLDAALLLIAHEPAGLAATEISRRLKVPKNTMSAHFKVLKGAGLITGERDGRRVQYHARMQMLMALLASLVSECCNAEPELCADYLAPLTKRAAAARRNGRRA
jgi:DNA-binding transcriptional ArsR family regulator